jgi:hypothetical protein
MANDDAPHLEPAIIPPPRFPKRRIGRFAFIAASLGALGMAALGYSTLRTPQASAHVDVHISSSPSPDESPGTSFVSTSRVTEPGRVQVALLLDTSSSMNGLIDQARSQLWKIVTRLDAARRDGQRPAIEIALYEYGNSGRGTPDQGWVRQIIPFTTDLDRISEALFSLDTNGGEEYVGTAIATAMKDLQWSTRKTDLKLLFVAGNEAFDQGPLDPAKAAAIAHKKGVEVTAILCGQGDPTWSLGAKEARFGYFEIDANQVVAHIDAPQDAEIARLGEALNGTYLAYGSDGASGQARQVAQDTNANNSQPGSMVWRSLAKSSASYDNSGWDLGDRYRNNLTDIDKIPEAQLPEEMRKMSLEERRAYVAKKVEERTQLQKRIQELATERATFIAAAHQKDAGSGSLDSAMLTAVEAQARAAGFQLDGK